MFDLNTVNMRYFGIKLTVMVEETKKELVLEVEPPKLKALKRITTLSKSRKEEMLDDLTEAVGIILSKNKDHKKVTEEFMGELDFDQLLAILDAYFEWLGKEKNSPN